MISLTRAAARGLWRREQQLASGTAKTLLAPSACVNANASARSLSTHLADDPSDRLIVIGSGVAGCSAALIAAEKHKIPVTLLCAGSLPTDCNSYWAQGGIIYRNYDPAAADSAASLVADVQRAGAGLCEDGAVWKLALEGPDRVRQLLLDESEEGRYANVPFDRNEDGSLSCCLEASHAAPRIIHFADHTGKAITEHITAAALNHPLISVVTDTIVTDLITVQNDENQNLCLGTHTLHKNTGQRQSLVSTRGTILASGGLGGIYQHSTNPAGFNALGSSTSLAQRAGAHTSDLEYVQFHPTALQIPNESCFLLTEALRGEGAILRDRNGRAFANDFHPDGELAPRDIVARGVFNENQKVDEGNNVFLDITHRDSTWLKGRFPSIDAHLQQRGLDITKDHLPITPAAHYTCGGVTTDLEGCTNILGLFSAGEAARTGLHGGNRLASTSLLEGLVYGGAAGDFVGRPEQGGLVHNILKDALLSSSTSSTETREKIKEWQAGKSLKKNSVESSHTKEAATGLLTKLKRIMWDHVGVVRTPIGLTHAALKIAEIKEEADDLVRKNSCVETVGIRDAAHSGEAVAQAALANRVSAGAHCVVLEGPDDNEVEAPHIEEQEENSNDDVQEEIGGFLRLR